MLFTGMFCVSSGKKCFGGLQTTFMDARIDTVIIFSVLSVIDKKGSKMKKKLK